MDKHNKNIAWKRYKTSIDRLDIFTPINSAGTRINAMLIFVPKNLFLSAIRYRQHTENAGATTGIEGTQYSRK